MLEEKNTWAQQYCAEHNGMIASLATLANPLEDLVDYRDMFKRTKVNWKKATAVALGAAGGAAVTGPLAYIAAPGVASALGAAGLLGTASTGTAISTLSGAALTSASVAAIGGGTMAGGMAVMTAVGGALGAVQGGVVSNSYYGAIRGFDIQKIQDGRGPALVFINGFLSEKNQDASDWEKTARVFYPKNPWYYVTWESKTLYSLGALVSGAGGKARLLALTKGLAKRASAKAGRRLSPLMWWACISDVLKNPWHVAVAKSGMTGVLLADLLARVKGGEFILMGNSLGARVVHYTLKALSTREQNCVMDVHLLGGACERNVKKGWGEAVKAVSGTLHNYYSTEDWVLKNLYRAAQVSTMGPIGLGPIRCASEKLSSHNVTGIVGSNHMAYKETFGRFIAAKKHKSSNRGMRRR